MKRNEYKILSVVINIMKEISVIVPLYKGEKYIFNIVSMIETNYLILIENNIDCDIELIFVNDYPEERNIKKIESEYISVKYVMLKQNIGIHGARVKGLKKAKGEYILFLDQDDTIRSEWMMSQLQIISDNGIVICNGKYRNGRYIYSSCLEQKLSMSRKNIERLKIISPGQALIKKKCIPKEWYHNILKHNGCDDYYLWLLMLSQGLNFASNNSVLYIHNESGTNQSFNWKEMLASKKEVLRKYKKSVYVKKDIVICLKTMLSKTIEKYKVFMFYDQILQENLNIYTTYRKEIIIYGMGIYGLKLLRLLKRNHVKIVCTIDKDANLMNYDDVKVHLPDEKLPNADIMVVTAEFAFKEIQEKYENYIKVMKMSDFLREFNKRYF